MNVIELVTKNRISLMWVPEYTTTQENDMAVEFSRQTADLHFIEAEPFYSVKVPAEEGT